MWVHEIFFCGILVNMCMHVHCGWAIDENLIKVQLLKVCIKRISRLPVVSLSSFSCCDFSRKILFIFNMLPSNITSHFAGIFAPTDIVRVSKSFQERLKPKLISHYPITSMKLNVDDSIKDNFLSGWFFFLFLHGWNISIVEQHVLKWSFEKRPLA